MQCNPNKTAKEFDKNEKFLVRFRSPVLFLNLMGVAFA